MDGRGAVAVEPDPVDLAIAADRQVQARAHRCRQIGHAGVLPHAGDDIERIDADAVLNRAVEIVDETKAHGHRGVDEGPQGGRHVRRHGLTDGERPAPAVPRAVAVG